MKPDASRLKQLIREVEGSRSDHVQSILQEQGPIREGSLVTTRRKCGKPNCRCAFGEGHFATYLSTKQRGKTRMVYVPAISLVAMTREAHSYRFFRKHRAFLVKLAQRSLLLIDRLQAALQTRERLVSVRRKKRGCKR